MTIEEPFNQDKFHESLREIQRELLAEIEGLRTESAELREKLAVAEDKIWTLTVALNQKIETAYLLSQEWEYEANEAKKECALLREKLAVAVDALEKWLSATPTRSDFTYCPINQPQACVASEALAKIRGEK